MIIITADDAYKKTISGEALLVCAYDDERFEKFNLEGAISFREFESMVPGSPATGRLFFTAPDRNKPLPSGGRMNIGIRIQQG